MAKMAELTIKETPPEGWEGAGRWISDADLLVLTTDAVRRGQRFAFRATADHLAENSREETLEWLTG